jgi:hypothetical protein
LLFAANGEPLAAVQVSALSGVRLLLVPVPKMATKQLPAVVLTPKVATSGLAVGLLNAVAT